MFKKVLSILTPLCFVAACSATEPAQENSSNDQVTESSHSIMNDGEVSDDQAEACAEAENACIEDSGEDACEGIYEDCLAVIAGGCPLAEGADPGCVDEVDACFEAAETNDELYECDELAQACFGAAEDDDGPLAPPEDEGDSEDDDGSTPGDIPPVQ